MLEGPRARWHAWRVADIFSVIADGTRRDILSVLLERRSAGGEASVSQLVDALGVPQPTVSKHLRTLRDAGLVTVREDGQHRLYSIVLQPFDELDDWLMPFIFADSDAEEESLGAAAFAAWAGVTVPASLKSAAEQARAAAEQAFEAAEHALARVGERAQSTPLGASLGRKAADRIHDVQEVVADARDRIHEVQERLQELQGRTSARLRGRERDTDAPAPAPGGDGEHPARQGDDARLD